MEIWSYLGLVALVLTIANSQAIHPVTNSTSSGPRVNLGYAQFEGWTNHTAGITYFRGLQFAQSPAGSLRWRAPISIEKNNSLKSDTVYDATRIAPACFEARPKPLYGPMASFTSTPMGASEDCLTLDILMPTFSKEEKLPVVVQIHSGGYTAGNMESAPGDGLVNASDGRIIFVAIQYRLGIFGFLGGQAVAEDGVLNAGLLDQRAALEWIQRHIHAFGGDPSRVTIWGPSAGGGSVTMQLIAGGGKGDPPFSAAIAEYPWWQPLLNQTEQDHQLQAALNISDCPDLTCLRRLPSNQLSHLNQAVLNQTYPSPSYGFGLYYFGPVVDGTFVQDLPGIEFQRGHFHDVPLLLDHDEYEGVIFSDPDMTNQVEETNDAKHIFPFGGRAFFSRLYRLYPRTQFNSTFFQRQTWFGDFTVKCPTYTMAYNAVERNKNASAVFKLIFDAGDQLHGATEPFLASNITGFPDAKNHTLAQIMASYWISFIATHDPNPLRRANAPFWPSYVSNGTGSERNGESVGFDVLTVHETEIRAGPDPDASARCEFWGSNGFVALN